MSKGGGGGGGQHGVGGVAGRSAREGGGAPGAVESPFAKHVESQGVSDMRVRDVVSVLQTLPQAAQQHIAKTPLAKLVVTSKTRPGVYQRSRQRVEINATRARSKYGETLKPGATWSISKTAKTQAGATKRTLVHEVGHHIHRTGGPKVERIIRKAYEKGRGQSLTKYGRTTSGEFFSESFTAYRFNRAALKQHSPEGYRMVRKVLREIGR